MFVEGRRHLRQHVADVRGRHSGDLDRPRLVDGGRRNHDRLPIISCSCAKRSKVFLAGPPLLKAATGEIAKKRRSAAPRCMRVTTGLGEYLAEDDADALRIARDIIAKIGWN